MRINMKNLSGDEREALLIRLLRAVQREEMSEGELLRTLRKDILAMNQDEYAALVNVSRRTLSDIERDAGNPSLPVLKRVFRPLGLTIGLLPRSEGVLRRMVEAEAGE
jgi:DNA-binding XRE family transcriptional regulator